MAALCLAVGVPAALADDGRGSTWLDTAAGVRFGLLSFDLRGEASEWNLGLGKTLDPSRSSDSYLGGGLTLRRTEYDPEDLLPDAGLLDGVGVGAWIGGCVNCPLGKIVQLNLEAKWAPGVASFLGDEDQTEEGRIGATLQFRW